MKKIDILFENEEILVINKPAGVAVQGGKGIAHPLDKELPLQLGYNIYLVHRLDMDTNGIMIVAKTPVAAAMWTKKIGSKEVKKEYTAVCIGRMPEKKGTIRTNVVQHGDEKPAVTHYEVMEEKTVQVPVNDENGNPAGTKELQLSTLKLTLETGRMHQIRIHLGSMNCPIAGDDKHGNFKLNKLARKIGIKNLQLTASCLTVPVDGKKMIFQL